MSRIDDEYQPRFDMIELRVYQNGENHIIVVQDGYKVVRMVEFSKDRKCLQSQKIDMIKNGDIEQYLNMPFRNVIEVLGTPHAEIGSGLYIPAYVTKDAYLICFFLDYAEIVIEDEDGTVAQVIKKDLLTDEIVEEISNWEEDSLHEP